MKTIAIVPARGGSSRLRDKNITTLAGKPLIHHTLDALSGQFEKIVVASDSEKILDLVSDHHCSPTTYKLPSYTTTDKSTVLESIVHLVCDDNIADEYDMIGMFLPTCPLRTGNDVSNALDMLTTEYDGVISITDYEFPPELGLAIDPDGLIHCSDASLPWLTGDTRSQDHIAIKRPNGAIYLRYLDSFRNDKNFYKGKVKSYFMPRNRSIDIDTIEDIHRAETELSK